MLHSILILITNTIASILVGVLLLRFWMQAVRVRPPVSIGQFIYQVTDWMVKPLRRVLPGVGGYDWATLVGAFVVMLIAVAVEMGLAVNLDVMTILLVTLVKFFQWICYGFIISLIIDAIFSWVNPHAPLAPFVRALNDPLLRPLRRVVPMIGNVDLSPLVALILLQILLRVVSSLIMSLA